MKQQLDSEKWRWYHALIITLAMAGIVMMLALACGCAAVVEVVQAPVPTPCTEVVHAPSAAPTYDMTPEEQQAILDSLQTLYGDVTDALTYIGGYLAGDADARTLAAAYQTLGDSSTWLGSFGPRLAQIFGGDFDVAETDLSTDGNASGAPQGHPAPADQPPPTPENPDALAVINRAEVALEQLP